MAGKVDRLVGLKENVILGHLIPAGTGFRIFQDAEVNYRREALEELAGAGVQSLEESFPLLAEGSSAEAGEGAGSPPPTPRGDVEDAAAPTEPPTSNEALDSMFGGGSGSGSQE